MSLQSEIDKTKGLRLVNKYVNELFGSYRINNNLIAGMVYGFVCQHCDNKINTELNNYIKSANLAIDLLGYIPTKDLIKLKDSYVKYHRYPDNLHEYYNKFMAMRLSVELRLGKK
jgi:hypothetical protein